MCFWGPYYRARFLSSPFTIKVPVFLLFGVNKGTLNPKGQKGTTQEPKGLRSGFIISVLRVQNLGLIL